MDNTVVLLIALLAVSLVVYFLPSIVAANRGHRDGGAIFALNLLLGWSFVGWCVALVWSLTSNVEAKAEPSPKLVSRETKGPTKTPKPAVSPVRKPEVSPVRTPEPPSPTVIAALAQQQRTINELRRRLDETQAGQGVHTAPQGTRARSDSPKQPEQPPPKRGPHSDPAQARKFRAAANELVRRENEQRAAAGLKPLWSEPTARAQPEVDGNYAPSIPLEHVFDDLHEHEPPASNQETPPRASGMSPEFRRLCEDILAWKLRGALRVMPDDKPHDATKNPGP